MGLKRSAQQEVEPRASCANPLHDLGMGETLSWLSIDLKHKVTSLQATALLCWPILQQPSYCQWSIPGCISAST